VREINLADAAKNAGAREHDPPIAHHPSVDERRRVAGDENENFAGITEAVGAHRDPTGKVIGDVVDEDEPEGEAPK